VRQQADRRPRCSSRSVATACVVLAKFWPRLAYLNQFGSILLIICADNLQCGMHLVTTSSNVLVLTAHQAISKKRAGRSRREAAQLIEHQQMGRHHLFGNICRSRWANLRASTTTRHGTSFAPKACCDFRDDTWESQALVRVSIP